MATPYKIDVDASTIYIAGPMTGIEEYNFPAFDAASFKFKEQGFNVINPAALSRTHAAELGIEIGELCVRECAMIDLVAVIGTASHMHMLKGWEYSRGAKTEHALAEWLDIKISYEVEESFKAYNTHNKEWWFAFQAEQFKRISKLTKKKNDDYTGGSFTSNPFANFDEADDFGVDPLIGLSLRMGDKMQRLKAFCNGGLSLETNGDTVADIFNDLIGYSSIALGMLERKKEVD
mgnify:FL=1|tara:strand:+ start:14057 stop:14758 length:702 start_codon:yes stop_codon:yes gene_type:complete